MNHRRHRGVPPITRSGATRSRTTTRADRAIGVGVAPLGHRSTFTYDQADRQITVADAERIVGTSIYDAAGRTTVLVNARSNGSLISRFTYTCDNAGNRTAVDQYTATDSIAWKYDKTYQLTNERRVDRLALVQSVQQTLHRRALLPKHGDARTVGHPGRQDQPAGVVASRLA